MASSVTAPQDALSLLYVVVVVRGWCMLGRVGKIVKITVKVVILLIALAIIGYLLLPVFMDYLPEPLRKIGEESYQAQLNRMEVFKKIVDNFGYEKCGEYVLKPGINSIDVYGVTDKPLKCYYIFRRPEPKDEYIVYLPWGEAEMAYVREEDRGKTIYYNFDVFGSLQMPHIWVNPTRLTPFIDKCEDRKSCGRASFNVASGYRKSFIKDGVHFTNYYEFVSQDGLMVFTVKSESEGMPIRFWLTFHAILYRKGEEKPILPPLEKHSVEELKKIASKWESSVSRGSPSGDLLENAGKVVIEYVENIRYKYCGRYKVSEGSDLNLTYTVEDPYSGEACYVIVESEEPLAWKHNIGVHSVWPGNMSKTSIENVRVYLDWSLYPFRNVMFDLLAGSPVPPAYSKSDECESWGASISGSEEWGEYFRKALILFYFKAESQRKKDVVVVINMYLSFKKVELDPIMGGEG
jgi:hypothetical protein